MLSYIASNPLKLNFAADDMVERLLLPERPGQAQTFVNLVGGERFPRVDDTGERMSTHGRDQCMNVIAGDGILVESVTLAIEEFEGVFDDFADYLLSEVTSPAPLVQPILNTFGEAFVEFKRRWFVPWLGMGCKPFNPFYEPLLEFSFWKGICGAEGREIGDASLPPMGQTRGGYSDWIVFAEKTDGAHWRWFGVAEIISGMGRLGHSAYAFSTVFLLLGRKRLAAGSRC